MDTRLSLTIKVPDDAVTGEVHMVISRGDDKHMESCAIPYSGVVILPTLAEAGSVNQWTVTALRDVMDRAIAAILQMTAEHQEIIMLPAPEEQKI